jgi:hypothetical protein
VAGTLEAMGPFSGYGADEIAKKRQTFIEGAQRTAGATLIDNARGDPKKLDAAVKSLDGEAFADLDPESKRALKDKAFDQKLRIEETQARKAEAAARQQEARLKEGEAALSSMNAMASQGTLTSAQTEVFLRRMSGTPYAAQARAALEQQAVTGALALQSPKAIQARIDALNADIVKNGLDKAKQTELKNLENVQRGQQADIKADPIRAYASRYLDKPLSPIDFSNPQTAAQGFAERVQVANAASNHWGSPAAPLLSEEIEPFRKMLAALPVNSQGEAVALISKRIGPSGAKGMAAALKGEDDKPLQLAFVASALGTPEGARNAQSILRGAKAIKDNTVKIAPEAISGWKSQINKEIDGALFVPGHATQAAEMSYFITADGAAQGGGNAGRSDIRRAVQSALGGEIVEQGQGRIVIPQGMTHSDLTRKLKSMKREDLLPQAPGGTVRAGGQEIFIEDLIERLPGATLATAAPGQYIVMVPRVMGGKPDSPVVNPLTGKPIIVSAQ